MENALHINQNPMMMMTLLSTRKYHKFTLKKFSYVNSPVIYFNNILVRLDKQKKQSDQGLPCLLFLLPALMANILFEIRKRKF